MIKDPKLKIVADHLHKVELKYGSGVIRMLAAKLLIEHETAQLSLIINDLKNIREELKHDNSK